MPGVVGTRRDLVQDDGAVGEEEKLDTEDAGRAFSERGDGFRGDFLGQYAIFLFAAGGSDDNAADAVALNSCDCGIRRHFAVGALYHHNCELVDEGNPTLGVHTAALPGARQLGPEGRGVLNLLQNSISPAIVAFLAGLEHQGKAQLGGCSLDTVDGGAVHVRRERNASISKVVLLDQLVLDDANGAGRRAALDALSLQSSEGVH
mmetsp:Transcript_10335/g.14855  ORF Transcript_10335/g.14855 Transcript_10335/m.14855 type:complete len:205 (-) Transcript_10335:253-867(-)